MVVIGDIDAAHLGPRAAPDRAADGGRRRAADARRAGQLRPRRVRRDGRSRRRCRCSSGRPQTRQDKDRFVPRLTTAGLGSPILDGLGDWFGLGDQPAAKELPPLNGNVIVGRPKTGAEVLMVHAGPAGAGRAAAGGAGDAAVRQGRSAAFTVDTTYLWFLPLRGLGPGQPVQQAVGPDGPLAGRAGREGPRPRAGRDGAAEQEHVPARREREAAGPGPRQRGDATRYAQVSVTINHDGHADTYALSPVDGQPGMYELVVPSPAKGHYTAEVVGDQGRPGAGAASRCTFARAAAGRRADPRGGRPGAAGGDRQPDARVPLRPGPAAAADRPADPGRPAAGTLQERTVPAGRLRRRGARRCSAATRGGRARYDLPIQGLLMVAC